VVKESLNHTDIVTHPTLLFQCRCIVSAWVAAYCFTFSASTGRQSTAARMMNHHQARSVASNHRKSTQYIHITYLKWFCVAGITPGSLHQPPDNRVRVHMAVQHNHRNILTVKHYESFYHTCYLYFI
jgi:hypothetical protein